jgi:ligand-binding SRPBCC domain-containing protein
MPLTANLSCLPAVRPASEGPGTYVLYQEQFLACPLDKAFAFFSDPRNLEAITPAWLHFHLVPPVPESVYAGLQIHYLLRWHGIPLRWTSLIRDWTPPIRFVDVQVRGPYRLWEHTHTFTAVAGGTRIQDEVRYALPLGPLGRLAHAVLVRAELKAIFTYRAQQVARLLGGGSA